MTHESGELVNNGSKGVVVRRLGLTHKTFSPHHGLMDFERSRLAFLVTSAAMMCRDWFHLSQSWRASFLFFPLENCFERDKEKKIDVLMLGIGVLVFLFMWVMALDSQKKEGDYDMMPGQGRGRQWQAKKADTGRRIYKRGLRL